MQMGQPLLQQARLVRWPALAAAAHSAQASTKFEIAGEWVFSVQAKSTKFQLGTI